MKRAGIGKPKSPVSLKRGKRNATKPQGMQSHRERVGMRK